MWVQCSSSAPPPYDGTFGGRTVTTDGNGNIDQQLGCYLGMRRGTIEAWVVMDGKEYEHRVWQ